MSTSGSASQKTCFIVGPIGNPGTEARNHADWFNDYIIKPVLNEHFPTLTSMRADEIPGPGMIASQIISHLLYDDLVIADMSMRNANAFYEIGIRHAVGGPIIPMYKTGEIIPFDVQHYRAIQFSIASPTDINSAKIRLRNSIEHVLSPNYRPDNPVIRARLEKNAAAHGDALTEPVTGSETQMPWKEYWAKIIDVAKILGCPSQKYVPSAIVGLSNGGMAFADFVATYLREMYRHFVPVHGLYELNGHFDRPANRKLLKGLRAQLEENSKWLNILLLDDHVASGDCVEQAINLVTSLIPGSDVRFIPLVCRNDSTLSDLFDRNVLLWTHREALLSKQEVLRMHMTERLFFPNNKFIQVDRFPR